MISSFLIAVVLHGVVGATVPLINRQPNSTGCKLIPGDPGWPERQTWAQLNQSVDGRLIATVPIGHVCHDPTFDQEECTRLQNEWGLASLVVPKPAEFMSSWFQNNSCTPFANSTAPCELGNYASYSIDVRSIRDVQAGLAFAHIYNLRLTVKNSGHDFFGKSTGKGALSLWVHNLNSSTLISQYNASYYNGPAVRIGAGVEGSDAVAFAATKGYRVVAGSCPTVKLAGGFSQGGGHSLLSGKYGFGSDNVLEWEAITVSGEHITATPTNQHSDLYWALSGGGGGTYVIVMSMTVRAFPEGDDISLASLSITVENAGGVDAYWDAVSIYHAQLQPLVDQGFVAEYMITNDSLNLYGMIAPGHTAESLRSTMNPMLSALSSNVSSTLTVDAIGLTITQRSSYHALYTATIGPLMVNNTFVPAVSGRFLPREVIENDSVTWHAALRRATSIGNGYLASITTLNARNKQRLAAVAPNSLQPNFETAFSSIIITPTWNNAFPWSEAAVLEQQLQYEVMPILEEATPGAGAYKNEASWAQEDFQEAFYAGTYTRLEEIKKKYDPLGVLYGLTAVGSEKWVSDSEGRLCAA